MTGGAAAYEGLSERVLDIAALPDLVALCARALPAEHLTEAELRAALFGDEQPAVVRGDPSVGVVATVRAVGDDSAGFVRLVAVDPSRQGRGLGRRLLEAAAVDLAGVASITVGADAPFYLFPGVPVEQTAMLCLLERAGFTRVDVSFNMAIDLAGLPPESTLGSSAPASPAERDRVRELLDRNYPMWTAEALRALDRGSLLVSRDDAGELVGFCACEVNRAGLLGPIGVRLERIGHGDGAPLLLAALHHLRRAGHDTIDVSWVGPIPPYARVGGRVSRVFFVYRRQVPA